MCGVVPSRRSGSPSQAHWQAAPSLSFIRVVVGTRCGGRKAREGC